MRKFILGVTAILLSILSINWISQNTNWFITLEAIKSISSFDIFFLVILYISSFILKILRFNFLQNCLHKSDIKTNIETICIGYFVNLFLPLRLGDVLRIIYIKQKINFPALSSLIVISTEKFYDVLIIFFILLLVNLNFINENLFKVLIPNFINSPSTKYFSFLIFIIIITIVPIISLKKIQFKIFSRFKIFLNKMNEIFLILKKPRVLIALFVFSISTWILEGFVFYQAAYDLNLQSPMTLGFLSLCFVALSSSLPSSPAGVGVFEASVLFAVITLSEDLSVGLSFAIIVHFVQFFSIILMSLVVIIFGKLLFK